MGDISPPLHPLDNMEHRAPSYLEGGVEGVRDFPPTHTLDTSPDSGGGESSILSPGEAVFAHGFGMAENGRFSAPPTLASLRKPSEQVSGGWGVGKIGVWGKLASLITH